MQHWQVTQVNFLSRHHVQELTAKGSTSWGAKMPLLSDVFRITPSVDNKLCNPPPSQLPLCLQSVSDSRVLKVFELILLPCLDKK